MSLFYLNPYYSFPCHNKSHSLYNDPLDPTWWSLGPHLLMLLPSPIPAPFSPHPSLRYGPAQQTCFCYGCGPFCGCSSSPRYQHGFLLSFVSLMLVLPQHFSNLLCLISFISNYYSNILSILLIYLSSIQHMVSIQKIFVSEWMQR